MRFAICEVLSRLIRGTMLNSLSFYLLRMNHVTSRNDNGGN